MRFSLKAVFVVTSIACVIAAFPIQIMILIVIIILAFLFALAINGTLAALLTIVVLILACIRHGFALLARKRAVETS